MAFARRLSDDLFLIGLRGVEDLRGLAVGVVDHALSVLTGFDHVIERRDHRGRRRGEQQFNANDLHPGFVLV